VSAQNQASSLNLAGPIRADATFSAGAAKRWAFIAFGYYYVIVVCFWIWTDRFIPDHIALVVLGHDLSMNNLHHHIVAAGSFGLLLVPAAFAFELTLVDWQNSSLRHLLFKPSASCRSDLIVFLLWQTHILNFCKILLTFGAALLSGVWLHDRLGDVTGLNLTLPGAPVPIAYLGYFLLYTFLDYWAHRLNHARYLWPIQRYHHSAQDFYILTSDRGHPADFAAVIAITLPLGLFDTPPEIAFWIYLVVGAEHLLIHSRIDSDLGWIGRYIVQSPVHHRLHHAHFGLIPLWDHLFGTWQGGGSQQIPIGVSDPYRQGIWIASDLWRDYCEFLAGIVRAQSTDPSP
jgi:sterol desaturase/sphingolipid hydroxylase (fatty acid hydroxylase superfamily)